MMPLSCAFSLFFFLFKNSTDSNSLFTFFLFGGALQFTLSVEYEKNKTKQTNKPLLFTTFVINYS